MRRQRGGITIANWLLPSLAYVGLMGGIGIVTKVALRHMTWQDMIVWTALTYAVVAIVLVASGQARIVVGSGTSAAIGAGLCASLALVVFYVALHHGAASRVVPITSAYPLVTLVLSAVLLAEGITGLRVVAAILVVAGVGMLALGQ